MLWRQGDVFIERIDTIPQGAALQTDTVVAEGEITGHQHQFLDSASAQVFRARGNLYVEVVARHAQLVHDEHAAITLKRGKYRVWIQREYAPAHAQSPPVVD